MVISCQKLKSILSSNRTFFLCFFAPACMVMSAPAYTHAEEAQPPKPALNKFQKGDVVLSLDPGFVDVGSLYLPLIGGSGMGVDYVISDYEYDYDDDDVDKEVYIHFGLEAGIFATNHVLLKLIFNTMVMDWAVEHGWNPWKQHDIGGGVSYFTPFEKGFADFGGHLGVKIDDDEDATDNYFQFGFHADLGFFLFEGVAASGGLDYHFIVGDENSRDMDHFRFRTKVSYFFSKKR